MLLLLMHRKILHLLELLILLDLALKLLLHLELGYWCLLLQLVQQVLMLDKLHIQQDLLGRHLGLLRLLLEDLLMSIEPHG